MDVHLVDGTFELFRAYYGPPGALHQGQEVGATRALLRSLLRLLLDDGATHVAVAFDTQIESFRNDLFDGYKTGEGIDPPLFAQFPLAETAARALGVVVWSMIEFEADDALCTFAARAAQNDDVKRVFIASPDKDLAQCVTGRRVLLWDRIRNKTLDEDAVVEKFGVRPAQIPDYLALTGDTADGIPGVPGIGAKTAALLLQRFGSVENLPRDAASLQGLVRGAPRIAAALAENFGVLALYKTLATLRLDVPLTETVADLAWQGADRVALTTLLDEIGDTRLLERVPRFREA